MKKILLLILVSTVLFLGCDLISDGGEGADVDSTNYYTKAEVDTIFAGVQGGAGKSMLIYRGSLSPGENTFGSLAGDDGLNEATRVITMPEDGTLKNLTLTVSENSLNGSSTIFIRINGADIFSVNIPAGYNGSILDTQNTSFNKGDLVCIRQVATESSSGYAHFNATMLFEF